MDHRSSSSRLSLNIINQCDFKSIEQNYILFEKTKINIIIDEKDMIWFLAKDVAKTLGYTNTHDPIQKLINKNDKILYKDIIHNSDIKMQKNTIYLNESGLNK